MFRNTSQTTRLAIHLGWAELWYLSETPEKVGVFVRFWNRQKAEMALPIHVINMINSGFFLAMLCEQNWRTTIRVFCSERLYTTRIMKNSGITPSELAMFLDAAVLAFLPTKLSGSGIWFFGRELWSYNYLNLNLPLLFGVAFFCVMHPDPGEIPQLRCCNCYNAGSWKKFEKWRLLSRDWFIMIIWL